MAHLLGRAAGLGGGGGGGCCLGFGACCLGRGLLVLGPGGGGWLVGLGAARKGGVFSHKRRWKHTGQSRWNTVLATKAVETQGRSSVLATKAVGTNMAEAVC